MAAKWITQPRDRLSARYKALHKQLAYELKQVEPTKQERKRAASRDFRATGGR